MNKITHPAENPTLKKIELFKSYKEEKLSLDELVNKIYDIDNPPPSKLVRGIAFITSVLFAAVLSSSRHSRD